MKIRRGSDVRKRGTDSIIKTHPLIPSSPHSPNSSLTHLLSSNIAIRVNHVSKKYCKSLKRSMLYGVKDIGRNILGMSSHSENLRKDEFWALNDVSFEVKTGETLGIIGPNGSGKTTLLKLLNGIFWPDKGKIAIRGRVGALIAVGAGFHPLLTGRENIYINGAILGMTKKEVDKKFDSIVEFADISDFIDTPVKFYSSGMFVRLGFSVAVHCEPDILLVDEVLAVGDMAFHAKCLQRMSKLKNKGIPIVFVSHNMSPIAQVCTKAISLDKGIIRFKGETKKVIKQYEDEVYKKKLALVSQNISSKDYPYPDIRSGTGEIQVVEINFSNKDGVERDVFRTGEKMIVQISFIAHKRIEKPTFNIEIKNEEGIRCIQTTNARDGYTFDSVKGRGMVKAEFPRLPLAPGVYYLSIVLGSETALDMFDRIRDGYHFRVKSEKEIYGVVDGDVEWGYISHKL